MSSPPPIALVTGASQGIGQATALELARAGFTVGLLARDGDKLAATRTLIGELGGVAISLAADVTDAAAVQAAVGELEHAAGPISLLVNNAGTMLALGPVWAVAPDEWWTDVRTSLQGSFICTRAVVPGMIERGEGRIVNVLSYAAWRPAPYQSGYAAGKAGLASLTESLAASLESHGIKVFGVAPAFTLTELTRRLSESEPGRRWLPETSGRTATEPARTAELVAWLASGAGDALNGRFVHTHDERDELLDRIEEIRIAELYVPRMQRLPAAGGGSPPPGRAAQLDESLGTDH